MRRDVAGLSRCHLAACSLCLITHIFKSRRIGMVPCSFHRGPASLIGLPHETTAKNAGCHHSSGWSACVMSVYGQLVWE